MQHLTHLTPGEVTPCLEYKYFLPDRSSSYYSVSSTPKLTSSASGTSIDSSPILRRQTLEKQDPSEVLRPWSLVKEAFSRIYVPTGQHFSSRIRRCELTRSTLERSCGCVTTTVNGVIVHCALAVQPFANGTHPVRNCMPPCRSRCACLE